VCAETTSPLKVKGFTEQMADFVTCPWSEGQGGDLDGEHSDILTHAITTLVGKKNDEAFGGNTMKNQWKQVKRVTLSNLLFSSYLNNTNLLVEKVKAKPDLD
jgi:hypothetical protein